MTGGEDISLFGDARLDRMAGLIFDLAMQLHVERQRRMALETVLARRDAGVAAEIAALAEDTAFLAGTRAELDRSLRAMMRVIGESGPAEAPLRDEAVEEG